MICVLVAVVAFLAGCEWMVQTRRRAQRRSEEALRVFDGLTEEGQ